MARMVPDWVPAKSMREEWGLRKERVMVFADEVKPFFGGVDTE